MGGASAPLLSISDTVSVSGLDRLLNFSEEEEREEVEADAATKSLISKALEKPKKKATRGEKPLELD